MSTPENPPEMTRLQSAYNRGSADSYYGRRTRPHIWLDNCGVNEVPRSQMSDSEIAEYFRGYDDTPFAEKDWT